MKIKKLFIFVLLFAVTGFAFSGGGGQTEKRLLIGHNNILRGAASVDIIERVFIETCKALDVDSFVVNDEAKLENQIANIDRMISAGVDGIVFVGLASTVFPILAEKCNAAGIPFVIVDTLPPAEGMDILRASKQFYGGAGSVATVFGSNIGEYAAQQGFRKAIILTAQATNPTHVARVNGFTQAFQAGGGTVLGTNYGAGGLADILPRASDMFAAHPDIDCVYGTSGDHGSAAIETMPKSGVNAKLFVTDLDPDILRGLKEGTVYAANGAHWVHINFMTSILVNHLRGHDVRNADGSAPMFDIPVLTLPGNMEDFYDRFWLKQLPYTTEELRALTVPWNTNVTVADYQRAVGDYTIMKRLEAKVAQGLLSREELNAALAK
jgi:ribose transport system substrate-binding protein